MSEPAPFTILCTGNVCRSPAVERLLAVALGPDVQVASAGTHALAGQPIAPQVDALLRGAGTGPAGFAARLLSQGLLRPADLVLTMTAQQRSDVVVLWPKAVRRTFTLKELARLLGECDPELLPAGSVGDRLRAAIPLAAAHRRRLSDPHLDDVIDPYGSRSSCRTNEPLSLPDSAADSQRWCRFAALSRARPASVDRRRRCSVRRPWCRSR